MEFYCPKCKKRDLASTPLPCCPCGTLWRLDFRAPEFDLKKVDSSEWSIFRYRHFMALSGEHWRNVSLGEGLSPILRFKDEILIKMEYFMPTLSYKDRGAAVLIAHCKAAGIKQVVQDSSGNAGNAVAAYCGKAGIKCEIFVPEGTSPKKIAMIKAHGSQCTVVPGNRDNCAEVCRAKVINEGVYYANHVYNPLFYEGTKTYVYEIYEQLGRIPKTLVIPVGNGTLFLGTIMALQELIDSGLIKEFPQIIAVQSENCDPLLQAATGGRLEAAEILPRPTMAEGIAIGKPKRAEEILEYSRMYGVRFVHAPEDGILTARSELAAKGVYVEHTTAANLAGYYNYVKHYGSPSDCLIPMCGAGLKSD